ncbi:hypothetical protein ACFXKX_23705 [Streptomyces scopuliridis]|uniref:hypothetical protein n=1 Tax=Streptomyces scopuliridis TaxID=452529 RepID=UPI0036D06BC9
MTQPDAVGRLTEEQHTRLGIAQTDLDRARRADVASMSSGDLIMAFETVRGALDDTLRLISEIVTND